MSEKPEDILLPKGKDLREWAVKIAELEPEVAEGVIEMARSIAKDRAVPKAERAFARAQVKAVQEALARGKSPGK